MNAHSLPNHATLSVRILKEATSVHVPVATFSRKMERPVEILMNVKLSSITASSFVLIPLEVSHVNVHQASHSITLLVLIIMNVDHSLCFVDQKESVRILLEVSPVNVREVSL